MKAYLANQLGFNEIGRVFLASFKNQVEEKCRLKILDPFYECEKFLNYDKLSSLKLHSDIIAYWDEFNKKVPTTNNQLMLSSDCMIALLDGGHSLDDGVSSEIGYYNGRFPNKPIFALRTDFRLCENVAGKINAQVMGYIKLSGKNLYTKLDDLIEDLMVYTKE